MEQEILNYLQNIGLTEKEAKIWLTVYKYGTKPASTIAKLANIERTLTYKILSGLIKKDLIKTTKINGILHFYIPSEKIITNFLNKNISFLTNLLSEFKKLEETLKNLKITSLSTLPKVEINEGIGGVYNLLNDLKNNINKNDYVRVFFSNIISESIPTKGNLLEMLKNLIKTFKNKRCKIDLRIGNGILVLEDIYKFENISTDFLETLSFANSPINMFLFKNYIYIFILKESSWGIKIYNEELFNILNFLLEKVR